MDQQCQVRSHLGIQCQHTASARKILMLPERDRAWGYASIVVMMCTDHSETYDQKRLEYINSVIKG